MTKVDEKFKKIPLKFEIKKEFELKEDDIRYSLAKLYIMHDGRNYNGSSFTKEVIEACKHTAYNMPIIGYIEDGDFSDHRYELEKDENGEYQYVCKEQAVGVIPESADLYMEERVCDDGIKRNYLVADNVIIWRKWNDVNKIFDDESQKWHSCELSDNYVGNYDKEKNEFVFEKFEFFGFTVLGDKYSPAMKDSNIEIKQFTKVNTEVIEENLSKFMKNFSKEVENLTVKDNKSFEEENKETEVVEEINKESEVLDQETEQVEESSSEEDNNENSGESEAVDNEDNSNGNQNEEQEFSNKREFTFSLSHEDIRSKLYSKLWEVEDADGDWYFIHKTTNEYFIYMNYDSDVVYKQNYTVDGDEVSFSGERTKMYYTLVDEETYNSISHKTYSQLEVELGKIAIELNNVKSKFNTLEVENKELKEFKANVEKKKIKFEVDEVVSKFSSLTELEYADLRDKAYRLTITKEELEEKLYALVGRKNFSLNSDEKLESQTRFNSLGLNIQVQKEESNNQYEDLFNAVYGKN
ncbi:MAG: hypothetical protein E6X72_14895 [Clostridioides difficile]|nr:hypothetical protein [Clostridioides difficile]